MTVKANFIFTGEMMKTKKHYRYRIYTEDILNGVRRIECIVGRYFPAFTVIETHGVYKYARENGLIVEIISEHEHNNRIEKICKDINKEHKQECCMVTIEEVQAVFI